VYTLANGSNGGVASNYTLADTTNLAATISRASISAVTGITANNKVYDGATAATLNTGNAAFTGQVAGDALTVATSSGNFDSKAAGTGKTVNITNLSLGGADVGNYTLASSTASTTADIGQRLITGITGVVVLDKTQDGRDTAGLALGGASFAGQVSGDILLLASATGRFASAAPGVQMPVTVSDLVLGGADAANYRLAVQSLRLSGTINPGIDPPRPPAPPSAGVGAPASAAVTSQPIATALSQGGSTAGPVGGAAAATPAASATSAAPAAPAAAPAPAVAPAPAAPSTAGGTTSPGIVVTLAAPLTGTSAPDAAPQIDAVVPRSVLSSGSFSFSLPAAVQQVIQASAETPRATDTSGNTLPGWLRFDAANRSFVASGVPAGGLPFEAVVTVGSQRVVVVIKDGGG
jgi:hypothetical protein